MRYNISFSTNSIEKLLLLREESKACLGDHQLMKTRTKMMKIDQSIMKKKRKIKPSGSIRKPHRYRPGTVALREIRKYQKTVDLLIPKKPINVVTREIAADLTREGHDLRFERAALDAIHESAEAFHVGLFEDTNMVASHAGRKTISKKDMDLVLRIRGDR